MPKLWKNEQDYWNSAYSAVFLVLVTGLTYYLFSRRENINNLSIFDFVILALAVFRLIRLFVYDTVTDFIRQYLAEYKTGPRKTAADLLSCPWCTGIWMSLVVIFIYSAIPYSWIFLLILALAGTGSIIQIIINKISNI